MGNIFQFKEFTVNQENCAMRINTDGVMLGAHSQSMNPEKILDIGTGTGVIALMLAQKYPKASVWAVEIDKPASLMAEENFKNSKFKDRLKLVNSDIFLWKNDVQFDLIVSNPPFYINSLHNPDQRKKTAKHTDVHFFKGLLEFGAKSLTNEGKLQIIVPIELFSFLESEAKSIGLFLNNQTDVYSFEDSEAFRCILSFGKQKHVFLKDRFVLYKERSVYTDAYKEILKPYFLAF